MMDTRFSRIVAVFRQRLGVPLDEHLDVFDLLIRMRINGDIQDYHAIPDVHLPDAEAQWNPDTRVINIRESILQGAIAGMPDCRFTLAHEIGHAVLKHATRNRKPDGRRQFGRETESDELEADDFAAALLAPVELVDLAVTSTPHQLGQRFGLPDAFASSWFSAIENLPGRKLRREPAHASGRRMLIDSGNYEDAFPAMVRNAE